MNLLCITHHDRFQGSTRSLFSLLEGLRAYPVTPHVIVPTESEFTIQLARQGIPFKILPVPWWMSAKHLSPRARLKAVREIQTAARAVEAQIRARKIDLVYTNSSVTPVGRLAARRAGVPHIWQIREFGDLDFSLYPMLPRPLFRQFIYSSQAIILNSQAIKEHYFQKRTSPKLHVIYNGVAFSDQLKYPFPFNVLAFQREVFTFLFIGSITAAKGFEDAIMAIAEVRKKGINSRLIVAGTGKQDYIKKCKDLARRQQVNEFIDFMGYLEDPSTAYSAADCLLMCSKTEAFGRVTAEAMAAGLPVIGRNTGGTPELIVDGETGILFSSFDELVKAMLELAQDRPLSQKLGLAGWQRARELFSIEKCAASVYQIIQSVVSKA